MTGPERMARRINRTHLQWFSHRLIREAPITTARLTATQGGASFLTPTTNNPADMSSSISKLKRKFKAELFGDISGPDRSETGAHRQGVELTNPRTRTRDDVIAEPHA